MLILVLPTRLPLYVRYDNEVNALGQGSLALLRFTSDEATG
jgi:hypothetical protein